MSDDVFDWERDYGPIWRGCRSAFWLAPEPGDRKVDVIDVRPEIASAQSLAGLWNSLPAQNAQYVQTVATQSSLYSNGIASSGLNTLFGGILGF